MAINFIELFEENIDGTSLRGNNVAARNAVLLKAKANLAEIKEKTEKTEKRNAISSIITFLEKPSETGGGRTPEHKTLPQRKTGGGGTEHPNTSSHIWSFTTAGLATQAAQQARALNHR